MSKIIIDTCAWIDFLRSEKGILGNYVTRAIETDQALLCGAAIQRILHFFTFSHAQFPQGTLSPLLKSVVVEYPC